MLSNNNDNDESDGGDLEEITVPKETPVKYFLHDSPADDDDAEDPTSAVELYGFETNQ